MASTDTSIVNNCSGVGILQRSSPNMLNATSTAGVLLYSEERFQNAFSLLQKTLEFMTNEYGVHYALLSCYKSKDRNSLLGFSSPGLAGAFFDNHDSEKTVFKTWQKFCEDGNFGENYKDASAFSEQVHKDLRVIPRSSGFHDSTLKRPVSSTTECVSLPIPKKPKSRSINDAIERLSHTSEIEDSENESEGSVGIDLSNHISENCSNILKRTEVEHVDFREQQNVVMSSESHTTPLDLSAAIKNGPNKEGLFISSITPPNPMTQRPDCIISPSNSDQTDDRPRNSPYSNIQGSHSLPTPEQILAKGSWMCPQCCKIIKYKRNARAHLMSHAAVRPCFSCSFCDQSFTTKWNLKKHLKLNHGIDMEINDPLMGVSAFDPKLADKKLKYFPMSSSPTMATNSFYQQQDIKTEKEDVKPQMYSNFPKEFLSAHVDPAKALQVLNSAANAGMLLHQGFLAGRMLAAGADPSLLNSYVAEASANCGGPNGTHGLDLTVYNQQNNSSADDISDADSNDELIIDQPTSPLNFAIDSSEKCSTTSENITSV